VLVGDKSESRVVPIPLVWTGEEYSIHSLFNILYQKVDLYFKNPKVSVLVIFKFNIFYGAGPKT
jgi:hypothetical protein